MMYYCMKLTSEQTSYRLDAMYYQCYLLAVIIILVLRVRIRDILEIPVEK
jgi:hypothetical protein